MMTINEMNMIMFDTTPFLTSIFTEEEIDKNAFGEVDEYVKARRSRFLCEIFKYLITSHRILEEKADDIIDLIISEQDANPYRTFYVLFTNITHYNHDIFKKDIFEDYRVYKFSTAEERSKMNDLSVKEEFREKRREAIKQLNKNCSYVIGDEENFDNSLVSLLEMVIHWLATLYGNEEYLLKWWNEHKEEKCKKNKKLAEVQTTIDAIVNKFCKQVNKNESC